MKRLTAYILSGLILALAGAASAADNTAFLFGAKPNANEPTDPEKAFVLSLQSVKKDVYRVRFNILDCCYLYREKMKVELVSAKGGAPGKARLDKFDLPPGKVKQDDILGSTEVYYAGADVVVPVLNYTDGLALKVTYQGCSEKGVAICYAPMTKVLPLKGAKKT